MEGSTVVGKAVLLTVWWSADTVGLVLRRSSHLRPIVAILLTALVLGGCSIRKLAVNKFAEALTSGTAGWSSEDDPELIGDALPFALKLVESLLGESPENEDLLMTACQGFAQYAYAFVELEAMRIEPEDYRESKRLRARALKLYLRGRDYCLRALELRSPGFGQRVIREPEAAIAGFGKDAVPLLVWTATAWGGGIALGLDKPEIVVDFPAVRALLDRAFVLEPAYNDGALHELLMATEALPETMGGSLERARQHYEKALELSGGQRASTYVIWASSVSVQQQDREEFEKLLNKALSIDPESKPDSRLLTLVYQDAARVLLDQIEDLFI